MLSRSTRKIKKSKFGAMSRVVGSPEKESGDLDRSLSTNFKQSLVAGETEPKKNLIA